MKRKKVTMQEIADRLGVSKVTVSKALNNKDGVGAELKEKIQQIARESGYRLPAESKKSIVGKQGVKKVAVFCDSKFFDETERSYFYVKIYRKIADELLKRGGIGTLLTLERQKSYDAQKALLDGATFDGVILLGNLDPAFVRMVRESSIPVIFVDSYDEKKEIDCVMMENFYTMYEATRYLLECGHREIGFVGSIMATQSITDRFLGYSRALWEWKISVREGWIIKDRTMDNEKIDLVLPAKMPQAFVCNCDETAYRLVSQLAKENIRVPEDVSIVSFDDDVFAELCQPPLTTVAVDINDMGEKAAESIMDNICCPDGKKEGAAVKMVKGNMVFRNSVKKIESN